MNIPQLEVDTGCPLYCSPLYALRHGLSLRLEFPILTRPARLLVPWNPPVPRTQHWGYRRVPQDLTLYLGVGDWNVGLDACLTPSLPTELSSYRNIHGITF